MKDEEDLREVWKGLPKKLQKELEKIIEESSASSVEELISEIFVGSCPKCGSKNTRDCEEMDGIEDVTVGQCSDCDFLWCTECGRPITPGTACEHWEICDKCTRKKKKSGDCGIPPWECEKISVFQDEEEGAEEEWEHVCAWCAKTIGNECEVFGLGAKARNKSGLAQREGTIINIRLTHTNKTVPAAVTTRDSEARKAGSDLMFMACSEKCGRALKRALEKEKFSLVGNFPDNLLS